MTGKIGDEFAAFTFPFPDLTLPLSPHFVYILKKEWTERL
jgi:hypothetical protein